jgi:hypothetical protein
MQGTAMQIAEFVAVLSCSLFTGAAVYITFIEHPARMQCGVEVAASEFAPSYRRATVMQVTLVTLWISTRPVDNSQMAALLDIVTISRSCFWVTDRFDS